MATRRKYKPKGFKHGGAVPIADVVPPPAVEITAPVAPATAPVAPPHAEDDPVRRMLEATLRAEALQRQGAPQQAPAPQPSAPQHDNGLSEHKRRFLEQHPEVWEPFRHKAMTFYYNQALNAGIADDTPEMDQYILQGIERELQLQRDQARANAAAMAQVREAPPLAPAPAPAAPPPPLMQTPLMPTAPKRSIPVAAPVSREVPTSTGRRPDPPGRITLSPDERDIAVKSRPDLPPHQAERLYAENKIRLGQLRASGQYPMPERN